MNARDTYFDINDEMKRRGLQNGEWPPLPPNPLSLRGEAALGSTFGGITKFCHTNFHAAPNFSLKPLADC